MAESSYRAYRRALARWTQWTARRGVRWQDTSQQADQIHIISEFIIDNAVQGFGAGRPVKGSTLKTYLAGIKHFHIAAGLPFPSDHPQVRMLLRGVTRVDAPPRRRAPVSVAILEACFSELSLQHRADQALWGVLCLSFFFLLRRSEIMAVTTTMFRWFALRADDISVVDASGVATQDPRAASSVRITIRGSKTNQCGAPSVRSLSRSGHQFLCPVLGALLLQRARGPLPGGIPAAIFAENSGRLSCVNATRVSTAIKHAARRLGEDPADFGTRSLRAGGATNMYRAGVDTLTIQFHGRWESEAFKLYTRLCSESVSTIACKIVSGARNSTVLR